MFNVICNYDLPDDLFEVSEEIIVHVAQDVPAAIKNAPADLVVLMDTGREIQRYLKSESFERMVFDNPMVRFLVVTSRSRLLRFLDNVAEDYLNMDVISYRDLDTTYITDVPAPMFPRVPFLDRFNGWCNQLVDRSLNYKNA